VIVVITQARLLADFLFLHYDVQITSQKYALLTK